MLALGWAAGHSDGAAAGDLRKLSNHAPHRASSGGDDHRLAGLRLADLHEPVPGGDSRHPQDAEIGRGRRERDVDLAQRLGVGDVELLPAAHPGDQISLAQARVLRLDHLRDGAADHDFAHGLGLRVGARVIHAAAHIRIEREIEDARQHLSLARRLRLRFHQAEIALLHLALGTAREQHLLVAHE